MASHRNILVATLSIGLITGGGVLGLRRSSRAAAQNVSTVRALPADKQALFDRVEANRQVARAHAPAEDPGYIPPPSASTVWRSGIIQSGLSPLPSEEFAITNQWQGVVDGIHVNVFAGASRTDGTQGVLVVMRTSASFVPLGTTMVSVPTNTGALHIESASVSNVLTVQSTSGQSWVFSTEQVSLG